MLRNTRTVGTVFVVFTCIATAGCHASSPAAPLGAAGPPMSFGPAPPQTVGSLFLFRESSSGFSTTDLRDAQGQIVQISTSNELVWTADGSRLPGFEVDTVHYP